jgi:hypothetical protein
MRVRTCIVCAFVCAAALAFPARIDAQQSTGQRIGTVVSDIVKTAFPVVKDVIDAIWPADKNANKKAADAQTALDAKKKAADANTRRDLDSLKQVSVNLGAVRQFLANCAAVDSRLAVMKTQLGEASAISDTMKAALHTTWDPAATRLDELKAINVDAVDDLFLKQTLTGVKEAIKDYKQNITTQIDSKQATAGTALRASLNDLQPKISGIVSLATILIDDMSTALNKAVADAAGAAGPPPPLTRVQKRDRDESLAAITRLYKASLK